MQIVRFWGRGGLFGYASHPAQLASLTALEAVLVAYCQDPLCWDFQSLLPTPTPQELMPSLQLQALVVWSLIFL